MRRVKVFVASSEELHMERLEFTDMIQQLNRVLRPRGVEVEPVKWEYLDASMGPEHKQEEYNRELRECEMCLVLYWRRFGEYTESELDTAYGELCAGRNPRKLYVYFKDSDEVTPELQAFKDSFATRYGHFFCRFENVDTMRLNFLLQFEAYQNEIGEGGMLTARGGRVEADGVPLVELGRVPFAARNPEREQLLADVERARRRVAKYPDDEELVAETRELEERLQQMEGSLLDTARLITRLSMKASSARLEEAKRLFEAGDNRGANAVLRLEDIDREAEGNARRVREAREMEREALAALAVNVEEYRMKVRTLANGMEKGWEREALQVYEQMTSVTRGVLTTGEWLALAMEYADFASLHRRHTVAERMYQACLGLYREEIKDEAGLAETLQKLAREHVALGRLEEANKEMEEAFDTIPVDEDEKVFFAKEAAILVEQGRVNVALANFYKAKDCFDSALKLYKDAGGKKRYGKEMEAIKEEIKASERRQREQFGGIITDEDWVFPSFGEFMASGGRLGSMTDEDTDAEDADEEEYPAEPATAAPSPETNNTTAASPAKTIEEQMQELFAKAAALEAEKKQPTAEAARDWEEKAKRALKARDVSGTRDGWRNALGIWRKLAEESPEAYKIHVADTLRELIPHYILDEDKPLVKDAAKEVTTIYREYAEREPEAYEERLADVLGEMGQAYAQIRNYGEMTGIYTEIIHIYQQKAEGTEQPGSYTLKLAKALGNRGVVHYQQERWEEAEDDFIEAIALYQQALTAKAEGLDFHEVALTRFHLGYTYRKEKRLADAEEEWEEAARMCDYTWKGKPLKAKCLRTLGVLLYATQRKEEARQRLEEALATYEEMETKDEATAKEMEEVKKALLEWF